MFCDSRFFPQNVVPITSYGGHDLSMETIEIHNVDTPSGSRVNRMSTPQRQTVLPKGAEIVQVNELATVIKDSVVSGVSALQASLISGIKDSLSQLQPVRPSGTRNHVAPHQSPDDDLPDLGEDDVRVGKASPPVFGEDINEYSAPEEFSEDEEDPDNFYIPSQAPPMIWPLRWFLKVLLLMLLRSKLRMSLMMLTFPLFLLALLQIGTPRRVTWLGLVRLQIVSGLWRIERK